MRADETVDAYITLSNSSTMFRAGDEPRLLVAGRYLEPVNPLFGHFPARYAPSRRGRAEVHWGPQASTLSIPVIPGD